MKKKLVAFLIGILMVVSLAGGQTAFAASEGSIQNGDIVIFGSYPQTKVTDSALIQLLNNKSKTWKKYPYYSKNTNSSNSQTIPTKQDITMMEYADVSLNGTMYRAVKIHKYRPSMLRRSRTASISSRATDIPRRRYIISSMSRSAGSS